MYSIDRQRDIDNMYLMFFGESPPPRVPDVGGAPMQALHEQRQWHAQREATYEPKSPENRIPLSIVTVDRKTGEVTVSDPEN